MAIPPLNSEAGDKDSSSTGFITGREREKCEEEMRGGRGGCRSWSKTKICCITCCGCFTLIIIVIISLISSVLLQPTLEIHAAEWESKLDLDSNLNINIDGSYMLMAYDDNYEPYLKSLGIPSFVVPLILRASETINVTVTETGATMTTETAWKTQELTFEWNSLWNMTYGRNMGVMWSNCTRETQNTILCTSEEREKGWFLTSKLIFSELGMVNERFFANQNIYAKKYYQRLGAGTTEQVWTTEMVEEVDIFEGNDLDEDGWDDWD